MVEEAKRRLQDARTNAQAHLTAEQLMHNLEEDLAASKRQRDISQRELQTHNAAIARLSKSAAAPRKTEADVAELQQTLRMLTEERTLLNEQIAEAQRASGDDK